MSRPTQRKYGFPLLMFIGFCVGAAIAIVVAFVLSAPSGRFSYAGLFRLVVPLGGLGAYIGHIIGAARNREAGFRPFGPLTTGVLAAGGVIVILGAAVVVVAVMGVMTLIKGHPPPH